VLDESSFRKLGWKNVEDFFIGRINTSSNVSFGLLDYILDMKARDRRKGTVLNRRQSKWKETMKRSQKFSNFLHGMAKNM
jgi:hypothetical protein